MVGADKVWIKFPLKENMLYKEAKASNKLTLTFSYCKILIEKMGSTPKGQPLQREPKTWTPIVPIPRVASVFACVYIKLV